jgi:flagellar biosynthesis/type III secretory pathway protein FliH
LREAYERGVADGRAALPWTEAERLVSACRALEEAARQLGVRADAAERIDRGLAVELGLSVARRVLAREIRTDLDALAPLVERAIAVLPGREGLTLELSPADLETLDAGRAPEIERIRRHAGAELVADARLAPGDVRLKAGGSAVDLRLDAVLERFRRELLTLAGREEERS